MATTTARNLKKKNYFASLEKEVHILSQNETWGPLWELTLVAEIKKKIELEED